MSFSVDNLERQIEERAARRRAARESEDISPVLAEMKIGGSTQSRGALQALMRNALSTPSEDLGEPELEIKIVGVSRDLERDGCDFIKMAYLFLVILECPTECRNLVLALVGISGGNSTDYFKATDPQIGELLGYDKKYIKPMREAMIAWQADKGIAAIDVREGQRDSVTRHFLPTEYRTRLVPVLADFLRDSRTLRTKSADYAQKRTIERGFTEMRERLSTKLEGDAEVERRSDRRGPTPTFAKPQNEQLTLLHGQRDMVVGRNLDYLRRSMNLGLNPFEIWREVGQDVARALFEMTKGRPEFTE